MLFVNKYIAAYMFSFVLFTQVVAMEEFCNKITTGAGVEEIENALKAMKTPSIYASAVLPALAGDTSIDPAVIDVLVKYADQRDLKNLFSDTARPSSPLCHHTYVHEQVKKKISEYSKEEMARESFSAYKISQNAAESLQENFNKHCKEQPEELKEKFVSGVSRMPFFSYIKWAGVGAGITYLIYCLCFHKDKRASY